MPFVAGCFYQVYSREAGHLLPVVLIHGAGGTHLYWPPQVRRLPGSRVYALDLPGHGRSAGDGCTTIGAYAERVHAWLETAGVGPAVLAGHSMGSAIALTLALEWPGEVQGLALLGAAPRLRVNPELLEKAAAPGGFQEAVDRVTAWSYGRQAPQPIVMLAARRMAETRPEVLLGDFLACNAFDLTAQLGEIRQPALVLCGEGDRMTPLRHSQALAAGLARARLEVIPGAGHMLMIERPAEVGEALMRFLLDLNDHILSKPSLEI